MPKRKITWTKQAIAQLNTAINSLADDKTIHRKDPYKKDNDGNYLYFETLKYRVVYYAQPNEVFIIRIRHTSMEPREY